MYDLRVHGKQCGYHGLSPENAQTCAKFLQRQRPWQECWKRASWPASGLPASPFLPVGTTGGSLPCRNQTVHMEWWPDLRGFPYHAHPGQSANAPNIRFIPGSISLMLKWEEVSGEPAGNSSVIEVSGTYILVLHRVPRPHASLNMLHRAMGASKIQCNRPFVQSRILISISAFSMWVSNKTLTTLSPLIQAMNLSKTAWARSVVACNNFFLGVPCHPLTTEHRTSARCWPATSEPPTDPDLETTLSSWNDW